MFVAVTTVLTVASPALAGPCSFRIGRSGLRRAHDVRHIPHQLRGRPSAATTGSTGAPTSARRRSSATPAGRSTSPTPAVATTSGIATCNCSTAVTAAVTGTRRRRKRVDVMFLADMRRHCWSRPWYDAPTCFSWAETFYAGVRVGGAVVVRVRVVLGRRCPGPLAAADAGCVPSRPRSSRRRARRRRSVDGHRRSPSTSSRKVSGTGQFGERDPHDPLDLGGRGGSDRMRLERADDRHDEAAAGHRRDRLQPAVDALPTAGSSATSSWASRSAAASYVSPAIDPSAGKADLPAVAAECLRASGQQHLGTVVAVGDRDAARPTSGGCRSGRRRSLLRPRAAIGSRPPRTHAPHRTASAHGAACP